MPATTTITVSVPRPLKERLTHHKSLHGDFNLSGVTARLLEAYLAERTDQTNNLDAMREEVDTVITDDRVRAMRAIRREDLERGHRDGVRLGARRASLLPLRDLEPAYLEAQRGRFRKRRLEGLYRDQLVDDNELVNSTELEGMSPEELSKELVDEGDDLRALWQMLEEEEMALDDEGIPGAHIGDGSWRYSTATSAYADGCIRGYEEGVRLYYLALVDRADTLVDDAAAADADAGAS